VSNFFLFACEKVAKICATIYEETNETNCEFSPNLVTLMLDVEKRFLLERMDELARVPHNKTSARVSSVPKRSNKIHDGEKSKGGVLQSAIFQKLFRL
jgi:hypothetical protein